MNDDLDHKWKHGLVGKIFFLSGKGQLAFSRGIEHGMDACIKAVLLHSSLCYETRK